MTDIFTRMSEPELLALLPDSVSTTLVSLERSGMTWDQVGEALAVSPTIGVALKGGDRWTGSYWVAVKEEMRLFLCADSAKYADLKVKMPSILSKGKGATASIADVVSVAIAAKLGAEAGVISLFVIWLLRAGMRIGKEALCVSLSAPPTPATQLPSQSAARPSEAPPGGAQCAEEEDREDVG